MGNALSSHHRQVSFSRSKVDFVSDLTLPEDHTSNFLWVFSDPVATEGQYSNFPKSVAEWLRDQIDVLPISYNLNNDFSGSEIFDQSFEALGITTWNGSVNVLGVPDYGYNINLTTQWDEDREITTTTGADYQFIFEFGEARVETRLPGPRPEGDPLAQEVVEDR